MLSEQLQQQVIDTAYQAGAAIMQIYQQDFAIYEKSDESPLTEADLAAHNMIVAALEQHSNLPILSEESANIDWQARQQWQAYWLVDPLDGTKEFIKKNGEFTVNIALIVDGKPEFGVVYAPVLDVMYVGINGQQPFAYKLENGNKTQLHSQKRQQEERWKVVGSRSHQSAEIQTFLHELEGESELVAMGSSLKLCLVAEGKAHLYPRLGPTSEWDTAAAHAVAEAAGATVTHMDGITPLKYNQKDALLNPYFLVSS